MRSLSGVRRRVDALARQATACEQPHVQMLFGHQVNAESPEVWPDVPSEVCVCGRPMTYHRVLIEHEAGAVAAARGFSLGAI